MTMMMTMMTMMTDDDDDDDARLRSCLGSCDPASCSPARQLQQRTQMVKTGHGGAKGKGAAWTREVRPATFRVVEWYSPPLPLALVRVRTISTRIRIEF
jgi:hypothetical protein